MSILHHIPGPLARVGRPDLARTATFAANWWYPGFSRPHRPGRNSSRPLGIPHIYARHRQDLFFAQGFVHAQDRLWQMELNRRIAQGCLSGLFGELALDTDRTTHTFGFNRLGRIDWANASAELREIILAYVGGVNAFLHTTGNWPVEFTLLNHRPELWRPEDVTAFIRVMIWQLSHAWYSEIIRAQITEAVGPEAAAELKIHYMAIFPPGQSGQLGSPHYDDLIEPWLKGATTTPCSGRESRSRRRQKGDWCCVRPVEARHVSRTGL
ncbi:MAG: penicillin acylase family protein [Anaerolineae bacterium]|nr:penicillin acylase family protein [Anaerolineae bacterium]